MTLAKGDNMNKAGRVYGAGTTSQARKQRRVGKPRQKPEEDWERHLHDEEWDWWEDQPEGSWWANHEWWDWSEEEWDNHRRWRSPSRSSSPHHTPWKRRSPSRSPSSSSSSHGGWHRDRELNLPIHEQAEGSGLVRNGKKNRKPNPKNRRASSASSCASSVSSTGRGTLVWKKKEEDRQQWLKEQEDIPNHLKLNAAKLGALEKEKPIEAEEDQLETFEKGCSMKQETLEKGCSMQQETLRKGIQ